MIDLQEKPIPKTRTFIPTDFKLSTWDELKGWYEQLLERDISEKSAFMQWILDKGELDAAVGEDIRWRYVHTSCNTEDKEAEAAYTFYVKEIAPFLSPVSDKLNRKLLDSPFHEELPSHYRIFIRSTKNDIALFNEANIPLFQELNLKKQEYGAILSKMMVTIDDKKLTLQQAGALLSENDREKRELVYRKISARRLEDKEKLDALMSDLIALRHKVAQNSGFDNYRDYRFAELGRFDYSFEDCYRFNESVKNACLPIMDEMYTMRKQDLNVQQLRPWDISVDPRGETPLRPFNGIDELVSKSIRTLAKTHPYFGQCLQIMQEMGRLDLDSRKGKRPGGYNMPLPESGVPFIFMNSANSFRNVQTMLHESGHAVHSFLMHPLELPEMKRPPSEVAELAAMTMELISSDYWGEFMEDKDELRRAKAQHLEKIIDLFPWVACVDSFQHWLYLNPEHSLAERKAAWLDTFDKYGSSVLNYEGMDKVKESIWHRQLHIFEVPFYYIEYSMAQLGAIAIWKRYRENPEEALADFINALSLGYTRSIPEIYEAAGIQFDFSEKYVEELITFVKEEFDKLA